MNVLLLDHATNEIRHAGGLPWGAISPIDVAQAQTSSGLHGWLAETAGRGAARAVFRPGRPGPAADVPADPNEAGAIESAFRMWTAAGTEVLHEGVRHLDGLASSLGMEVMILPQVGSLVSDIPGWLGLQRRFGSVGLFLEPAAMLPSSHESHAPDLFDRFASMIELHRPGAILVGNLDQRPLDSGPMDPTVLAPLVRRAIEAGIPLVLRGDGPSAMRQLASLGDPSIGYS